MAPISALLIAAALVSPATTDVTAYAKCRGVARALHKTGCAWRSGSLFVMNGSYPVRIAFPRGRPDEVVIDQPNTAEINEFVPEAVRAFPLHNDGLTAVDGSYFICNLRKVTAPTAPGRPETLDAACFAGTRGLHPGTISWIFAPARSPKRVHPRH